MEVSIRQENVEDRETVLNIIESAFQNEVLSDQTEHKLVDKLRQSESFIPSLSLIAEYQNEIVGHILFTKLFIESEKDKVKGLALAPVTVKPDCQNKGIGSQLIKHGHRIAEKLNYKFILLVGHESYYPKFGYKPVDQSKIKMPFEVPYANCMIHFLDADASLVNGNVIYDKCFFE